MQQRSPQQVRVSVSLIFLIHGLIIATWASRIPAFQAHLHLSPAVLGRSLMMAAIGSVLAMPAAEWLINKFGSLSIVIGSTLGFGLALPLIADTPADGRLDTRRLCINWPIPNQCDSSNRCATRSVLPRAHAVFDAKPSTSTAAPHAVITHQIA